MSSHGPPVIGGGGVSGGGGGPPSIGAVAPPVVGGGPPSGGSGIPPPPSGSNGAGARASAPVVSPPAVAPATGPPRFAPAPAFTPPPVLTSPFGAHSSVPPTASNAAAAAAGQPPSPATPPLAATTSSTTTAKPPTFAMAPPPTFAGFQSSPTASGAQTGLPPTAYSPHAAAPPAHCPPSSAPPPMGASLAWASTGPPSGGAPPSTGAPPTSNEAPPTTGPSQAGAAGRRRGRYVVSDAIPVVGAGPTGMHATPTGPPPMGGPGGGGGPASHMAPPPPSGAGVRPGQQQHPQQHHQQHHAAGVGPATPPAVPLPDRQCPDAFMNFSMRVVPHQSSILVKSQIPLGCVVRPLAPPPNPEQGVPVVDLSGPGIVRCKRCRAYVNPFVRFLDTGRRWLCNLCHWSNDVPASYFAMLDERGQRTDLDKRPELRHGCVEFVAPAEYMVRPPQAPAYMFVVDVSFFAMQSGLIHTVVSAIRAALDHLPGDTRTKVGFITFDTSVHVYNLRPTLSRPQMLALPDVDNVFLPVADSDLLVNLAESRHLVDQLLQTLPTLHTASAQADSCVGSAAATAYHVMQRVGGKVLLFASSLGVLGATYGLKNREQILAKHIGTDQETQLFKAPNDAYTQLGNRCNKAQIAVDLFAFTASYVDAAALGHLVQISGGQLYHYPFAFTQNKATNADRAQLYHDVWRNLSREVGFEGVMRLRCSQGVSVNPKYIFGNFFIRSTDLLALPSISSDSAFGFQLKINENLTQFKHVSFQAALLYTNADGSRRIRVMTQCLPVTANMGDMFKTTQCNVLTSLLAKMVVEKALASTLSTAREALVHRCAEILKVYRASFNTSASATQLVLPGSMQALPLQVLGLLKSLAFRSAPGLRPDQRAAHMSLLRTGSVNQVCNYAVPRLWPLHALADSQLQPGSPMPDTVKLTTASLSQDGAYLMDSAMGIFVWIGSAAPVAVVSALFGVDTVSAVNPAAPLPELDTPLSQAVHRWLQSIRLEGDTWSSVYVIREGDPLTGVFLANLVEDKSTNPPLPSYFEFLAQLQRAVQGK